MAVTLTTLELAKWHLRVTTPDEDALIEKYVAQAEALTLSLVYPPLLPDVAWTAETVPEAIEAALWHILADLWANRGDQDREVKLPSEWGAFPPPPVRGILRGWMQPVVA